MVSGGRLDTNRLFDLGFEKNALPIVSPPRGGRVLGPRVVALPGGGYRLYYMEYGPGCPKGVSGVVVSAISDDGGSWRREHGVRLGPVPPRASARVLSPDIVLNENGRWRMYAEGRSPNKPSVIISAYSDDGISWIPKSHICLADPAEVTSYGTPNVVRLPEGGYRLYCHAYDARAYHIVSAISEDGIVWELEPGVRIAQDRPEEAYAAYSPYVWRSPDGDWMMLYSGWCSKPRLTGKIYAAVSNGGLKWERVDWPILEPGDGFDSRHCSEPCLFWTQDGAAHLVYESCDFSDTWRLLSSTVGSG